MGSRDYAFPALPYDNPNYNEHMPAENHSLARALVTLCNRVYRTAQETESKTAQNSDLDRTQVTMQ